MHKGCIKGIWMELEWIGYGREMPRVSWVLSLVMDTFQLIPHSILTSFLFISCFPRIAYCSQQPWIRNESLRENVLFGEAMDIDSWSFKWFVTTEGDSGDAQPQCQLGFQGTCSTLQWNCKDLKAPYQAGDMCCRSMSQFKYSCWFCTIFKL